MTEKKPACSLPLSFFLLLLCLFLITSLFSYLALRTFRSDAPTAAEGGMQFDRVVLDAGHGGEDGGAVSARGYTEKDLNLALTLCLGEQLEAMGVEVIYTRTEDILLYDRSSNYEGQKKRQDLAARRAVGEAYPDALFVSIHMNAFPMPQYAGVQLWYSPNHPASRSMAEGIQELIRQDLQQSNHRRVKEAGSGIYLLHKLESPALLIECGLLSNEEEAERLNDPDYRRMLSLLMMLAILEGC